MRFVNNNIRQEEKVATRLRKRAADNPDAAKTAELFCCLIPEDDTSYFGYEAAARWDYFSKELRGYKIASERIPIISRRRNANDQTSN